MQTSQLEQIMDVTDASCRTHSERLSHVQAFDHARDVVIAELNQADALCVNDPRHYTRVQSLKILNERRESYKKLWKLLIDKDMNKADLRRATGLSSFTIAKLTNGKDVSTSILKRICEVMKCDVGDILEIKVDK